MRTKNIAYCNDEEESTSSVSCCVPFASKSFVTRGIKQRPKHLSRVPLVEDTRRIVENAPRLPHPPQCRRVRQLPEVQPSLTIPSINNKPPRDKRGKPSRSCSFEDLAAFRDNKSSSKLPMQITNLYRSPDTCAVATPAHFLRHDNPRSYNKGTMPIACIEMSRLGHTYGEFLTLSPRSLSECARGTQGEGSHLSAFSWSSFPDDDDGPCDIDDWLDYEGGYEADEDLAGDDNCHLATQTPTQLNSHALEQHDQRQDQIPSDSLLIPTFSGDKLVRAVLQCKAQKELAKVERERAVEEFEHLFDISSDDAENATIDIPLPDLSTSKHGTTHNHPPVTTTASKAQQWLEIERQKVLSAKWQRKKMEQKEQTRLLQKRQAAVLEQRKREPFRVLERSPMMQEDPVFAKQLKLDTRHRLGDF